VAFGVATCLAAVAPTLRAVLPLLVVLGGVNVTLFATSSTLLQLKAEPAMRGRVLAIRGMTSLGTTPIGAPMTGWICERWGPRWGLATGGIAALVAAAFLWVSVRDRAVHQTGPSAVMPVPTGVTASATTCQRVPDHPQN
jgi:MFS family permease